MSKAKEDLKAILDLAYELSVEHGYSYIDFCVVDGRGVANTSNLVNSQELF